MGIILTASSAKAFRTCRRKYYWRNVREIVLAREEEAESLWFGTLWHRLRECWLLGQEFEWPTPEDHRQRELLLQLRAMDAAYRVQFADDLSDDWHPEVEFCRPLIVGGKRRYGVMIAGKIDAIRSDALMEHKTASKVDAGYIERLPVDGQILTYSMVTGLRKVIYDVAPKPTIQLGAGETAEEFAVRKAGLEAKSTTGKPSTAKQRVAESDESYLERLAPTIRLVRETLAISGEDVRQHAMELYELAQQIKDAAKRPGLTGWYRNGDACTHYGRTCPYLSLCRVHDPERVIESGLYARRPAHEELSLGRNNGGE